MIVMKFGGTSVADSEAINRVMSIVQSRLDKNPIIVVSALSKITDTLYMICDFVSRGESMEALMLVGNIRDRHLQLVSELIPQDNPQSAPAAAKVNEICDSLKKLVEVICDLGELSDRSRARIISTGEYLSSGIICHALNACGIRTSLVDARQIIITDGNSLKGEPDIAAISRLVPQVIRKTYSLMEKAPQAVITQGFVSATEDGRPTVLGRGGSDYSASLIGMAVQASEIEIWTDVDGVHTADPRKVQGTRSLPSISYMEAAEMAHSGAKVLHPSTIEPAVNKNIPISVLNSRHPDNPGTRILSDDRTAPGAKSVSSKDNLLVVNVFSTRAYNASGFLSRAFTLLGKHHLPIDMITVSESTLSFTVGADEQISPLLDELAGFSTVFVENDKAQVSVVGKDMVFSEGTCQKIFRVLEGYTVYLVSQGASGNKLSFVVDKTVLQEVMNKLHKELFR